MANLNDWRVGEYLQWLCTPVMDRDPTTKGAMAEKIGVTLKTLNTWEKNPEFLAEWERLYRLTVGSPDRVNRVFDTLYETAIDRTDPRHVTAADKYINAVGAARPQKLDVNLSGSAKELTDEQLAALVAERAQKMLDSRAPADG